MQGKGSPCSCNDPRPRAVRPCEPLQRKGVLVGGETQELTGGLGGGLSGGAPVPLGWLVTVGTLPADGTTVITGRFQGSARVEIVWGKHGRGSPVILDRTVFIAAPIVEIDGSSTAGGAFSLVAIPVHDRSEIPPGADGPAVGSGDEKDVNGGAAWDVIPGAVAAQLFASSLDVVADLVSQNAAGDNVWIYRDTSTSIDGSTALGTWRPIEPGSNLAGVSAASQKYRPCYLFNLSGGAALW